MPDVSLSVSWSRRAVLGLGLGGVALLAGSTSASATSVIVDQITFEVPNGFRAAPAGVQLGQDWQWSAVRDGRSDGRPAAVILARSDVDSTTSDEIFGLLLAPSMTGTTPELELGSTRTRAMPGGSAARLDVTYAASRGFRYHGAVLAVTRPKLSAAVIVVLGDDTLTAGTIDGVLGSTRWLP